MEEEKQIERLNTILQLIDDDKAKSDDVVQAIEAVLGIVVQIKTELEQKLAQNKEISESKYKSLLANLNEFNDKFVTLLNKFDIKTSSKIENTREQLLSKVNEVINMIPVVPSFEPLERQIAEVESKIPKMPDIPNIQPLYDEIEKLRNEIEEAKKMANKRPIFGGGGFSKIAMDSHFLDPYTPTGTVNGVNTDFTLSHTASPTTSLKVWLNGQKQKLTTDYTLTGNTITFLSAPPTNSVIEVEHRI